MEKEGQVGYTSVEQFSPLIRPINGPSTSNGGIGDWFMANMEKFKELVLYLSEKSVSDKKFGSTKLNKLLFYCDFIAYAELGASITGVTYQRITKGPAPKCMVPVRDEMVESKELAIQPVPLLSGHTQRRPVNLRRPNLTLFSGEEISLVDTILQGFSKFDADQISNFSHGHIGWLLAQDGETIPYGAAYFSNEPLTADEIRRGNEIADARGRAA